MVEIEILEMTKDHEEEYKEKFADEYFPYTLGFKHFVEALDYETHYLLAIHDGHIVNALCLSKCGGSAYTPFGFAGGAINSRYIDELYSKAKDFFKRLGCQELAIVSPPFENVQPPTSHVEWRFAQVTALQKLEYPRTIRKEISHASKISFDIEIDSGKDIDKNIVNDFYELCKTNISRKDSTTHDKKFIEAVLEHLDSELWACRMDGELRAAVLLVKSSRVIDYFMVGQVVDETKRKYALEWLIHNIIQAYDTKDFINWQGSCDNGTKFFKERFRANTFWYPVSKHSLQDNQLKEKAHILDVALKAGTKLGEFWLGKRVLR